MTKKITFLLTSLLLTYSGHVFSALEAPPISLQGQTEEEREIVINNRILLKITGKPISVIDVVKKMDLLFYRQYPDLLFSTTARYEFYMSSFRMVFSSLVNDLLVMADAEEKKIEITDGEVREELESLFGPNVVANIDSLEMSYDEAWDLIHRELVVRRMTMMMVRSKAGSEVLPKDMKVLYDEYLKANPPERQWRYQILTLRGKDKDKVQEKADKAYQLISEESSNLNQLILVLKDEETDVSLSEEYLRKEKEISKAHKDVLETVEPQHSSNPLLQPNKGGGYLARLFFLKDASQNTAPPFNELEDKLQRELLQKAMQRHSTIYAERLRERYGITDNYLNQMIPSDFEPFALR